MKKLIAVAIILGLCFNMAVFAKTVSSESDIADINEPLSTATISSAIGQKLDIKAKSVILMEPNTKKILYEDNADEKLSPASITKIMSLLLVIEAIDRGEFDLETVVSASKHACSMGGSQIWLEENESMTVDDLLKATVIASANDACVCLGEFIAGSEEGFVALMNERAKELGMNNTTFKNCTGLDAEGHLTSAYDVAVMSSELIKHDLIKKYSTVWMDTLRDGESELVNTNKLVRFYEGTTGLKTGTTSIAKYCLSATAKRGDLELVAVVLAGETSSDRFEGAKKLLDYGFSNYSFEKIEAKLDKNSLPIEKGVKKEIAIKPEKTLDLLLTKINKSDIKQVIEINENITAPVNRGDSLGTVKIYSGENLVGSIEIVAKETVKKLDIAQIIRWIVNGMFKL